MEYISYAAYLRGVVRQHINDNPEFIEILKLLETDVISEMIELNQKDNITTLAKRIDVLIENNKKA